MSKLEFRQAKIEDLSWLDSVHTSCMKQHVERHYDWNPDLFRERFREDDYVVVQLNGRSIGFFKIIEESEELYLADMMITPEHQGTGLGSEVLEELIGRRRQIRLQVLKSSPARKLYERKGFVITKETEHHFQMRCAV